MEKLIAKWFIIFLPLRMISIISPIQNIFGMQAESLDFIFLIFGLLCALQSNKGRIYYQRRTTYFWEMIAVFLIISFIMSIYVFEKYGYYNGNSPFVAVIKLILDFVQYGLIIEYTKRVFHILSEEKILKYLVCSTRIALVVGYIQIAALLNIPVVSAVYSVLAKFFSWRTFPNQIALSFYEPSWAAIYIGVIVVPLHMAIINKQKNRSSKLELLMWLPVIIMTKSTTSYLLVFAAFGIALLRMLFFTNSTYGVKLFAIVFLVIGCVFINYLDIISERLGFNITYLAVTKVTDMNNQSTASRMIPLIGNLEIFKRFPIIGCGNGLQGYFFPKVISPSFYSSFYLDKAVYIMLRGDESTIPNGQLFIPGILSGYGIVGIMLFSGFIMKSINNVKRVDSIFKEIYLIGLLPLLITGFKSEFVGIIYIWFLLGIPYSIVAKTEAPKKPS